MDDTTPDDNWDHTLFQIESSLQSLDNQILSISYSDPWNPFAHSLPPDSFDTPLGIITNTLKSASDSAQFKIPVNNHGNADVKSDTNSALSNSVQYELNAYNTAEDVTTNITTSNVQSPSTNTSDFVPQSSSKSATATATATALSIPDSVLSEMDTDHLNDFMQLGSHLSFHFQITLHLFLASKLSEAPLVQYKIWNIDIPSTWLGLKGTSFTMTPRLLLEVLYGYQANVMPHSVVPDVIYSAACNPSSVLLTSSLVDIRSPVGSAKMQGQILGKVGDILTSPSQVPVLGINEADSKNESIFAGWKQLNILGNTTGRHFVLVFLTSPERPSSPVSSMNHRWMPFRSYRDPSSILPPGRMHLVSSASYPVLPAHMDPIPSISCPAPPAHMNLIPSVSYPAPPAR
ncbi:hypothetical protein C8R41DRAFT_924504 [Lentinula lateritia]|uniref:Uncharacterized protein n=1 Tax=Lentinula lateritia TaxID=40482 RepID=A0ABQ8V369_9AGAR|nr:hypothetical protein C8R41DRAFT_924504 [Lentinula lateritia]